MMQVDNDTAKAAQDFLKAKEKGYSLSQSSDLNPTERPFQLLRRCL